MHQRRGAECAGEAPFEGPAVVEVKDAIGAWAVVAAKVFVVVKAVAQRDGKAVGQTDFVFHKHGVLFDRGGG
ncbi:hypothetical protein D3C72_2038620 [compost metagenome]